MAVRHAKVSAKSDGGDSTLVLPSDWNADHVDFSSLAIGTAVSGSYAVNRANGETHDLTLVGAATATLSGASTATDEASDIRIVLRQDATGGHAFDLDTNNDITWVGMGTASPTFSTAANAVDVIGLLTTDGGSAYFGFHTVPDLVNPMTTVGDIIYGGVSGVTTRMAAGTAYSVLTSSGTAVSYQLPPGHELAYAAFTATVSVTATTEAGSNTIVTAPGVTFDGSTRAKVEFYLPKFQPASVALAYMIAELFDGSTSQGHVGIYRNSNYAGAHFNTISGAVYLTPSAAAHTFSIRANVNTGTATVDGGSGGAGVYQPGYIRITVA